MTMRRPAAAASADALRTGAGTGTSGSASAVPSATAGASSSIAPPRNTTRIPATSMRTPAVPSQSNALRPTVQAGSSPYIRSTATALHRQGPVIHTSNLSASARASAALTSSPLSSPAASPTLPNPTRRIPSSASAPYANTNIQPPVRAGAAPPAAATAPTRAPLALNRASSNLTSSNTASSSTPTSGVTLTSRPSLNRSGSLLNDVAARRAALVHSLAPQPTAALSTTTAGAQAASTLPLANPSTSTSSAAASAAATAGQRPPSSISMTPPTGALSSGALVRPPSAGRHVVSRSAVGLPTSSAGDAGQGSPVAGANMDNVVAAGSVIRVGVTAGSGSSSSSGTMTGAPGASRHATLGVRLRMGTAASAGSDVSLVEDDPDMWLPGQAGLETLSGRLRAVVGTHGSSSSNHSSSVTASSSAAAQTAVGVSGAAGGGPRSYSSADFGEHPQANAGSGGIGRFGATSSGISAGNITGRPALDRGGTSSRVEATATGTTGTFAPSWPSRPSQEGLRWRGAAPGTATVQANGGSTAGTSRSGSGGAGQMWDSDDDEEELLSRYSFRRTGGPAGSAAGSGPSMLPGAAGGAPTASASGVMLPGSAAYQERFMNRMAARDQERQRLMANLRASQDDLLRQAEDLQLAMAISMSLSDSANQPTRATLATSSAATTPTTPSLWPQQLSTAHTQTTAATTSSSHRDASAVADAVINAARNAAAATSAARPPLSPPLISATSTPTLSASSSGPGSILSTGASPPSSLTSGAASNSSSSPRPFEGTHTTDSPDTAASSRRGQVVQNGMTSSLGGSMIAAMLGTMAPRNPAAALLGEALFGGSGNLVGGPGPANAMTGGMPNVSPFAAMLSAAAAAAGRGTGLGDLMSDGTDTEEDGSLRQPLLSRLQTGLRDMDAGIQGAAGSPTGRRGALLIRTAAADGTGSWFLGIPGPGGTISTVRIGGAGGGGFQLGDFADGEALTYDRLTQLEDVKVPTPKEVLDALPETTYHRRSQGGDSMHKELFLEGPCSICMEEYSPGEQLTHLPCRHCFHTKCAREWLGKFSKVCPVCKGSVSG